MFSQNCEQIRKQSFGRIRRISQYTVVDLILRASPRNSFCANLPGKIRDVWTFFAAVLRAPLVIRFCPDDTKDLFMKAPVVVLRAKTSAAKLWPRSFVCALLIYIPTLQKSMLVLEGVYESSIEKLLSNCCKFFHKETSDIRTAPIAIPSASKCLKVVKIFRVTVYKYPQKPKEIYPVDRVWQIEIRNRSG